jgi:DNA-directed RNA polymerase subunit RPC12/RpoP
MPITFDTAGNTINKPITLGTVATATDKYTIISSPHTDGTVKLSAKHIEADALSKEAIEQIKQLFNAKPLVEYSCHNCGAKLQLEPENHIFKCKYCGSVYMVGLDQINSGK